MLTPADLPTFPDTTPWEQAQHELESAGLTDGLPVVPPTRGRLDAMLVTAGDPDRSYGPLPPLFGEVTPRAVAYNAVLAGCRPGELAVVVSALAATLDPGFNLLGIQTTTGAAAVATIVHGPLAAELGMNAGAGCLGPGSRANACIGRAVQLALVNVGGAAPGTVDMATMGQPGKYGLCVAEADDPSYPPFHVRRGLGAGQGAVTVVGVIGTVELVPPAGGTTPEDVLAPVADIMRAPALLAPDGTRFGGGEQFVLVPPEVATGLRRHGWTLERIQEHLFHRARTPRRALPLPWRPAAGGEGPADDEAPVPAAAAPGDIHVLVTGGTGIKMTYLPTWAGGTMSATREVLRL